MAASQTPEVLHVEGTSRVVIHVGKAGALGFAGHTHEVEGPIAGTITVDPAQPSRAQVVLEFDSAALRVTGRGEPAQDVPEVQRVMASDRVLDVKRYPTIVFRSRQLTASQGADGSLVVTVTGDLTLHGVTREVTVPVRATLAEGVLAAEGYATIKQSDFGIQPVTAAGGTVRVKDDLEIAFTVRAAK